MSNNLGVIIEIDHFDHRSRLWRIVGDGVAIINGHRTRTSESHQCVSISRSHVDAAFLGWST